MTANLRFFRPYLIVNFCHQRGAPVFGNGHPYASVDRGAPTRHTRRDFRGAIFTIQNFELTARTLGHGRAFLPLSSVLRHPRDFFRSLHLIVSFGHQREEAGFANGHLDVFTLGIAKSELYENFAKIFCKFGPHRQNHSDPLGKFLAALVPKPKFKNPDGGITNFSPQPNLCRHAAIFASLVGYLLWCPQ